MASIEIHRYEILNNPNNYDTKCLFHSGLFSSESEDNAYVKSNICLLYQLGI